MKENVASSTVFERGGGGLIHNIDERKNPDNLGLCKVGFLKHELKQNGKNGEGGGGGGLLKFSTSI